MSFEHDNDCVGCPQGCIHCGRGDFIYVSCDGCGESGTGKEEFFDYKDWHFCPECFKKVLREDGLLVEVPAEELADASEEDRRCYWCETDAGDVETMYRVDGVLVCDDCLDEYLKENFDWGTARKLIERKYGGEDY